MRQNGDEDEDVFVDELLNLVSGARAERMLLEMRLTSSEMGT